jgi:protein TonB
VVADGVFKEFAAKIGPHYTNLEQAKKDLESSLSDVRLINLEARDFFERRLVSWLVDGWQPGNEALIGAATLQFSWDKDGRQLYRFGHPGQVLDRAIHEMAVFNQQNATPRHQQREAIRRLRADVRPTAGELIRHMPAIEEVAAMFPVLLPLIANAENIRRWRKWDSAIPRWRRWVAFRRDRPYRHAQPVGNSQPTQRTPIWIFFWGILVLASFAGRFGPHSSAPAGPSPYQPSGVLESLSVQQRTTTLSPALIAGFQVIWVDQIRKKN